MPATDPQTRALVGRIAAVERWAHTPDRSAATKPARDAMDAKFERLVDPDNQLDPTERARRAAYKRTAYFQRLALKSAQARRKAKTLTTEAAAADAEMADMAGGDSAA